MGRRGPAASSTAEELLAQMTLEEKAGQMVMGLNAPGWPISADPHAAIRQHGIGSLLSFAYHTMSPTEAAELNNELQRTAAATRLGIPILNSADFEQGLASLMLHNATALPYQMGLAAVSDPEAADRAALVAGREIKAAGFHWTFAPVADVNNNPANPVIGVRSFGSDTGMVTDLTARQVRAYRRAGIMTTVKHFPGHGDTATDSHTGLPIIPDDWETLSSVHLPPFLAAIDERVESK